MHETKKLISYPLLAQVACSPPSSTNTVHRQRVSFLAYGRAPLEILRQATVPHKTMAVRFPTQDKGHKVNWLLGRVCVVGAVRNFRDSLERTTHPPTGFPGRRWRTADVRSSQSSTPPFGSRTRRRPREPRESVFLVCVCVCVGTREPVLIKLLACLTVVNYAMVRGPLHALVSFMLWQGRNRTNGKNGQKK